MLGDAVEDPLAHADALDTWLHEEPDATDGTWCYRYTLPAAVISYVDGAPISHLARAKMEHRPHLRRWTDE
ncbi:hypothetical protein D8S78_02865 [Natrialba swarupiae]|nr:hypothetical protein [Natrialba swarupiae]